jgi:hypothetical protein
MAIPGSVATGLRLLRALRGRDVQAATQLATRAGKLRIAKLLAAPSDPCAQAIASSSTVADGRVQGQRAQCRFADLPDGRVAVLDLVLEPGGWRLDDARVIARTEYDEFGKPDEAAGAVAG